MIEIDLELRAAAVLAELDANGRSAIRVALP